MWFSVITLNGNLVLLKSKTLNVTSEKQKNKEERVKNNGKEEKEFEKKYKMPKINDKYQRAIKLQCEN